MIIRALQIGDESSLRDFLLPHSETCMFMLSNLRKTGLAYKDEPFYGEYIAAFSQNNEIQGVLVQFWNGSVMACVSNTPTLNLLITYFKQNVRRPITGIVGENQTTKQIIDELGLSQHPYSINQSENLYAMSLDALDFVPAASSDKRKLHHITEIERALIYQWLKDYEIESLGRADNEELNDRVQLSVSRISRDTDQWILSTNNTPVSLCGFNARLPDTVQIGPVWTPPLHRNKGYARYLVAWTLFNAKLTGVRKSVLFTKNPAAATAYQAIGFEKIGKFRLALLKNPCFPN